MGVVLNGPPGCGKDTIANLMSGSYKKHQFKDALYAHTADHFEVDLDKLIHYASERSLKDSRNLAGLGGRTPREALIHVSEEIFKPRFGDGYFGNVELGRLQALYGDLDSDINVVYPDGGFASEIYPIESFFDILIIIRLHRDGFDFKNDSRSYLYLPNTEKRSSYDVHLTAGDVDDALRKCLACISLATAGEKYVP